MPTDSEIPSCKAGPATGDGPARPAAEAPPKIDGPPPTLAAIPPPLPRRPEGRSSSAANLFSILLSGFLGLFLAEAVVSLADDSLILFSDLHALTGLRGFLSFFAALMAIGIYGLMGLAPAIPKRLFLPLTLFNVAAGLVVVPCLIYCYGRIEQVACIISYGQVVLGLGILYQVQGGWKLRWPLVAETRLTGRPFSWRNLCVFLLVNVFVLVPLIVVYLAGCARLAVDHFSDGFVALRREGLVVQVRNYVRSDGKMIQLVPMSHIGEPEFYRQLAQSFPTNATILMEGVTDDRNLLTNKISYQRMAASLGVAEQHEEFMPRGEWVRADVDVGQFATTTIDFLNLVMLFHARGMDADTATKLMQYAEPAHFREQLFDDLLEKRNGRVLQEIKAQLARSEIIIVPWGAAHMPGIAKEIQKSGFRMVETHEYIAIRFGSAGKRTHALGGKVSKGKL